jgi:intracellular sulfur oxidation DsrE/DsrF family protein
MPGKHRLCFDTYAPDGFALGVFWANNVLNANKNAYGLTDADSAIIIVARHDSLGFALNDAMWAKYSAPLSERAHFVDPKTKSAPTRNVFLTNEYGPALPNLGVTATAVTDRGVRLAVCSLALRGNAGVISRATGAKVDDLVKELSENLVPGAILVPAGIVAVSRAQERGFTFAYAG